MRCAAPRSKYVMTAIRVARLLVEAFGELIRASRHTNTAAIGLDLTAETRLQRCVKIQMCELSFGGNINPSA